MKVAIIAPVRRGLSLGGVKHLEALIECFKRRFPEIDYEIFYPEGSISMFPSEERKSCVLGADEYRRGFRGMVEAVNASDCDVVLNLIARPLAGLLKPCVVIVQNIEPLQHADYKMSFVWRARLLALRFEHKRACRQASVVIAVSEHVKNWLMKRFQLAGERIEVVYHGVPDSNAVVEQKPECVQDGEFVFCAGSIVPYRGYEDVIYALGCLKKRGMAIPKVVFAGSVGRFAAGYAERLKELSVEQGVEDSIVWAGSLNSAQMKWCYKNCLVFVQTSRAEACPNIVLEALSYACVSLSCDHEPMPEIFGDAAFYYRTGDGGQLADALSALLEEDVSERGKRLVYVRRASRRARLFEWSETGARTIEALRRAIEFSRA